MSENKNIVLRGANKPEQEENSEMFSDLLNKWREREQANADCVRLVLIGKTGVGKSATGNTILGNKEFKSFTSGQSITKKCKKRKTVICSRMVQVIDTPGLFDAIVLNDNIRDEIGKCITLSSPGPHVFLLLISVGRFTQEERETVKMIQEIFGQQSRAYTMVGFTRGEVLEEEGQSIEEYIATSPPALKELIADCGGRYHVFCNKNKDTREQQVLSLLDKMDRMIQRNGGRFYTTAMFEDTEMKIRAKEMRLLQHRIEELDQAISDMCMIKLALEKKLGELSGKTVPKMDLKQLGANQHDDKINEIDGKILAELDSIRKQAEIAVMKGKKLQTEKCTTS